MNRLIIIGAGGHGKVIADIALATGYSDIAFVDDNESIRECAGFPVIGRMSNLSEIKGDKIVAIGNSYIREKIMDSIDTVSLIHPGANIGRDVDILPGSVVMAGAVINHGSKIGRGCIINTCSSVDHDCVLEDYVHIAVGAHLCGSVNIGANTWIGSGAIVINNVRIGPDCMIGAGAVVVRDITSPGTYVGMPAKAM